LRLVLPQKGSKRTAPLIAIDTNILVYAHRSRTREHAAARRAIERAAADPRGWGMALPCLGEFWAVVTHPEAAGRPSTPAEAAMFLRALVQGGGAAVWMPRPGFDSRLLRAAERIGVSGQRVFDLQIALIALEAGAEEIWSHDHRFRTLPGLELHDPIG
jgi:toxin-antitoxin system PIN domain toxin